MDPLLQSSCTRSELEADSRHTNNLLEYKQPMGRHFSKPDHKNTEKNGGSKIHGNKTSFILFSVISISFFYTESGHIINYLLNAFFFLILPPPRFAASNDGNLIPWREEDASPRRMTCSNDINCEKASRDMELVHIIDNQQKNNTHMEMDVAKANSRGNDDKCFSIPAHQLELSLRRSDYSRLESKEKNERRTLNHSTSSPFSL